MPAIEGLPRFLRYPIFLPTERVPLDAAIAGLARVKSLYDSELDATYRPRLRALKAARRDRRCFVIGNGPSLARTDLTKLADEVTFATNGFFLKMPELDWKPTYYVVEDHLVGEDRADELTALEGSTKLYPASLAYALPADPSTIYFDHRPRKSFPDGFDFSFDAETNTWTGGTVTFTCLQLAAYLGYTEIYLVGVDADYAIPADAALSGAGRVKAIDMASDDPNHFHPDYFGKGKRWHEPNVEIMLAAYEEARRATEARGVSIVNATLGGKLEVFPRIDYEMLFRPTPAEKLLVIDHTQIGDGTATGEVKSAVLGSWPAEQLMQVYDRASGRLRIAGDPLEVEDPEALIRRIAAFDPDLVLYRPVPHKEALHDFARDFIARTNLPLAMWIVDDWPAVQALEEPAGAARMDADLRALLDRADARFSISPAMSAAFHERYGHPFAPIANGIDPADWPAASLRPTDHLKVRYAGGLDEKMTLNSVGLVAGVVERLAERGMAISLEIKTHRHWRSKSAEWLGTLKHTSVSTSDLTQAEYRQWLTDADVLLIAYNFDARSRDYIRYSLANKLPECLAAGAPTLAVGPDDVATIATMAALEVGERIVLPDEDRIARTLARLAESPELRLEIAERAQAVAFSLFAVDHVRHAFDAGVGRIAAAHHAGDYPPDLHVHVDETAAVARLLEDRGATDHEPTVTHVGAGGPGLAALRAVDWDAAPPDAVACEFEDAGSTRARGAWRDVAASLRNRGYAVYLSEWHPARGDDAPAGAGRDDWRRLVAFNDELEIASGARGTLLAFREDPGLPAVRGAFERLLERGVPTPAPREPVGVMAVVEEDPGAPPAEGSIEVAAMEAAATQSAAPAVAVPARRRRRRRRRPPIHRRGLRLARHVAAGVWRRRRWTAPAALLLVAWTLVGFIPGLGALSLLVWGSAGLAAVGLASLYVTQRLYAASRRTSRSLRQVRRQARAHGKRAASANARLVRVERALADATSANADLMRYVVGLEQSIGGASAPKPNGRTEAVEAGDDADADAELREEQGALPSKRR